MKQYPNNLKFKKYQKLNLFNLESLEIKKFILNYGSVAIQSLELGKLKFKHIESCRRTLKRGLKKIGNLWIKLFTNIPIYKKSLASRMGKGKGNLAYWVVIVRKGMILFEISGINFKKAVSIFKKSKSKLPIKTKIIKNIY